MIENTSWLYLFSLTYSIIGMSFLFIAWKSWVRLKDTYSITGWALLCLAAWSWSVFDGWVFGLIYFIAVIPPLAFVIAVLNAEPRGTTAAWPPVTSLGRPGWRAALGHLGRFSLIVPFALLASVLPSIGLGFLLPMGELNQMVFAVCALPLIWGAAGCFIAASPRPVLPSAVLILLSAVSLLPIYLR